MTSTISAIIPVYNGRSYLRETIATVVAQTRPPDELIVVDDGSTDGSVDELEHLDTAFPIKVVHQLNSGQSAARNHAARLAGGDLLAFLDQDDLWHPNHLESLHAVMDTAPEAGWAYNDFDEIDELGQMVTKRFINTAGIEHPKWSLASCVEADLMVIPSASVIRRDAFEAVGGFDEALRGYEDDDLYIRMFQAGWHFVFVPEALTKFRVHSPSSSAGHHFLESRMRFGNKLQVLIADNDRLSRYYFRDLIAPRLFLVSLDDYVRAVSRRDWVESRRALDLVNHFGRLRGDHGSKPWILPMIQNPRVFRCMLQLQSYLPASLRPSNNPTVRLR